MAREKRLEDNETNILYVNDFGKYVLKNYNKMGGLLGICETSE